MNKKKQKKKLSYSLEDSVIEEQKCVFIAKSSEGWAGQAVETRKLFRETRRLEVVSNSGEAGRLQVRKMPIPLAQTTTEPFLRFFYAPALQQQSCCI